MEPQHGTQTDPPVDNSLQSRMIRAARLDPALYDEVKADPNALPQAAAVVLLASVATGIGFGQGDLRLIILGVLFALLGWYLTAYLSWFIGTRLLPEPEGESRATPAELLRAIGFSNSPGIVRLLAAVPDLALIVIAATTVWMLCATVVAIRQGLALRSTARAVGVYVAIQLLLLPVVLLFAASGASPPQ
jgi:hypothetical protein